MIDYYFSFCKLQQVLERRLIPFYIFIASYYYFFSNNNVTKRLYFILFCNFFLLTIMIIIIVYNIYKYIIRNGIIITIIIIQF